jgi:Family of unknown function (DUF6452)
MKKITVLLLFTFAFYSCEKDDICAESTPTTPKLIIRFYDISNQEDTKSVTGLKVTSFDDNNVEVDISNLNILTTDSINLPLRTDVDLTKFVLYKDYVDDVAIGNPDTVTIRYEREDVYVSRACGFKTIFKNLSFSFENDSDNWIVNDEIINSIIDNETTAHVKIFH